MIPIIISLSRVIAAPFIILYCLAENWTGALVLVIWCMFSDWLDGAVARRLKITPTRLNTRTDSLADATFSLAMVVGLYVSGQLPVWLLVIMIATWWPASVWRFTLQMPKKGHAKQLFRILIAIRTTLFAITCGWYLYLGSPPEIFISLTLAAISILVVTCYIKPQVAIGWITQSCDQPRFQHLL